jgi:phenylacetic acid degradation operon negative regulatory protein
MRRSAKIDTTPDREALDLRMTACLPSILILPGGFDRGGDAIFSLQTTRTRGMQVSDQDVAYGWEEGDQDAAPAGRLSPGSARSLLLTLFGEFARHSQGPVWTATLLHVLQGVGVAEKSARQAILRTASSGWIENVKDGRRASWTLTERGRDLINAGSERLRSLQGESWEQNWLILHISLPETHRALRVKVYRTLNWLGFGNPAPALWVCPHVTRQAETKDLIARFDLSKVAFGFVGKSLDLGVTDAELAARAWDMGSVLEHYRQLALTFGKMRPRAEDAILFAHVQLVNQLQRLPYIDPGLPASLLPTAWRGQEYATKLGDIRQRWHDAAHIRWAELANTPPAR